MSVGVDCCEYCDDGDGISVFPYYGIAPHTHDVIGGMVMMPKNKYGDDFIEDPESPGQGTYVRCPKCGRG